MSIRHKAVTAAAIVLSASAALAAPPVFPPSSASTTLHGVEVPDPYRQLENVAAPETRAWLEAQGRYAAEQLAAIPGRDAMHARIAAFASSSGDQVRGFMRMPGGRIFYLKRKAGTAQYALMVRDALDKPEKLLVDPVAMAGSSGVPHAINWYQPSWDGNTLAYGVSAGGSEDASLYLMDLRTGKAIGEPIPRVLDQPLPSWMPDSRTLAYNQLRETKAGDAPTEKYKDSTVYLLSPGGQPKAVFGPLVNKDLKLDRLDVAGLSFSPDSTYVVARTTDTTVPEGKIFVAPVASLSGAANAVPWTLVSSFDDKITSAEHMGDTLYLRTYKNAPRGRVLALDLRAPQLAKAREIIAEPKDRVLQDLHLARNAIYTEQASGFGLRVMRHDLKGGPGADVAPSLDGSTFPIADPGHANDDLFFATSAWTAPSRVLRSTGPDRYVDTRLREQRKPDGAPELEVDEVLVSSHDGAKVPLAVIHRKGLRKNGDNPTLLVGYGAYGLSMDAYYDLPALAWFERGGVLALANVRGSGAFGDAWHRAGFKTTKPNTWKDGIACARWLVDQKYASTKTLGIWGTSAGGIFVGRAVTTAPELFAAAVFDVGMLDTVRSEESANGATNVSEFGTVKDPVEFKALLEMSTYNAVRDGVNYPAVLLVHGMNDPRVDVWNSAKTAARLQAASKSGKPVLLRLDTQAGHGIGNTANQTYATRADIFSFLLWQMGKTTPQQ